MNIDIKELAAQILASRRISSIEQKRVSKLLFDPSLGDYERTLIARLAYGVRHGLLEVVE